MPALSAPSPITATTWLLPPARSRATAMPSPEEIEVEECAAPNGSYSLSLRRGEPDKPPSWGKVRGGAGRAGALLGGEGSGPATPRNPAAGGAHHRGRAA